MVQVVKRARLPIKLDRKAPRPVLDSFMDYFQGFEKVQAVQAIFGDDTKRVLEGLRIGFIPNRRMYMGIRDNDGNLAVGTYHLKNGPTRTIYLDIVHELFHIKQRMTDEKYFHKEFAKFMRDRSLYYASPIEIPAYEHTVREAERIGMSEEDILEYLKIGDAPPKIWGAFVKAMKLRDGSQPGREPVTDFPVKIKRDVTPIIYPFTRYFAGFEKVQAVKDLFRGRPDDVLKRIMVEFIDSPFPTISPSEDDGHLIVARDYFGEGTVTSIYLDVFLCLNLIKRSSQSGSTSVRASGDPNKEDEDMDLSPAMRASYAAMVEEGRRLGLRDSELLQHTMLLRFLLPVETYNKFLESLQLGRARGPA